MPKKASNKSILRLNDFSGGLNDIFTPAVLNENEVSDIENWVYDEKGALKTRGGTDARYSQILGKPIIGMTAYYKKDGSSYLILATPDGLYYDLPRQNTTYDSKAEFDNGTYFNTKCSAEGNVTIDPIATTMTRNSVAYDGGYNQVAVNTARFADLWR